jgi:hypothetical protein
MCPEGLYESLVKIQQIAQFNGQDLPILISENGTAEVVDHNRSAYITAHLGQMQRAINDGVRVIGYLHWSIADNWEWIDGYRREARFGLFSVAGLGQAQPANLSHSITDGALALAYAARDPASTIPAAVARYGRYTPNGAGVEHPSMTPHATYHGDLGGRPVVLLLSSPQAVPAPLPQRYFGLTGMLYYADQRRWVRLRDVVWEQAAGVLHFSHGAAPSFPRVPERFFAGQVIAGDPHIRGVCTEVSGNAILRLNWQLTRPPLAGMWQVTRRGGAKITLSLGCPEGVWTGRALFAMDWNPLTSLSVTGEDFTAWERGSIVDGSLLLGFLSIPQWQAGLQRLPDAIPF